MRTPVSKLFKICLFVIYGSSSAESENSFEYELDPYYSNAGYYMSLTDRPIPEIKEQDEEAIAERMLSTTFSAPRTFLIEASINPLPFLGAAIKDHHPNIYEQAQVNGDLNIIQALAEGFEEPYAVSMFLGNVVRFVKPGEEDKTKNRGYTGWLLSMGDKHIINNDIIDDRWNELEWKFKGDQDFEQKTLSWSFRVGVKTHSHPEIANVFYLAYRRNHFDQNEDTQSFIDNSDIEYKLELNKDGYRVAQQSLFINRKWPVPFSAKSAFSLGIGFIVEKNKYSGALATQADEFRVIIRPNFQF